jgi:hypothetical protein
MSILLVSCFDTNSNNTDEAQISDILYEMQVAYNTNDFDKFMSFVQNDYFHNNMLAWNLRELWLTRKAEYPLITIDNISVSVDDRLAIATFRMTFESANQTLVLLAPSPAGEISYFRYNGDRWLIFGNHL